MNNKNHKKMGNKGQVTIFIIIGMIALIMISVFIYLQATKTGTESETAVKESLREKNALESFTEECLIQTGLRALKKIGEQGGYAGQSEQFRLFRFKERDQTQSDGLFIADTMKLPYWFYMNSPNKCTECTYSSNYPDLLTIKSGLSNYMKANLNDCLQDFDYFVKQGYIIDAGEPTITFEFTNKTTIMRTTYPVKSTLGDKTFESLDFVTVYDLPFIEFYDIATALSLKEFSEPYLEKSALMAISAYSSKPSEEKIPPISWSDHDTEIKRWSLKDTTQRMEETVIPSAINLLQVNGSKNYREINSNDLAVQNYYSNTVLTLPQLPEKYEINFIYNPEWRAYIDINPRIGDILAPSVYYQKYFFGLIPDSQENYYEFFYDISFPVLVVIRDKTALSEYTDEGYTFMFALEGNIIDNKNLYEWNQGEGTYGPTDYTQNTVAYTDKTAESGCTSQRKSGDITDFEYVCAADNKKYSTENECTQKCIIEEAQEKKQKIEGTLFCDYEQWISKENTVQAFDANTREPLGDVQAVYGCGNFQDCFIGKTNPNGMLETQLPICINGGHLLFSKTGYILDPIEGITTSIDKANRFEKPAWRIVQKNVTVRYINITNLYRYKRDLERQYVELVQFEDTIIKKTMRNSLGLSDDLKGIVDSSIDLAENTLKESGVRGFSAKYRRGAADIAKDAVDVAYEAVSNLESFILDYSFPVCQISGVCKDYFTIPEQDAILNDFIKHADLAKLIIKDLENKQHFSDITENDSINFRIYSEKLEEEMAYFNGTKYIERIDHIIGRGDWDKNIFDEMRKNYDGNINKIYKELLNIHFLTPEEIQNPEIVKKFRQSAQFMEEENQALIAIKRKTTSMLANNVPSPTTQIEGAGQGTLYFVPGEYTINVQLLVDTPLALPPKNYTFGNVSKTLEPPAMPGPVPYGGVLLSDESGLFSLDNAVYEDNKLVLYVFRFAEYKDPEDMTENNNLEMYSKKFHDFVKPELK